MFSGNIKLMYIIYIFQYFVLYLGLNSYLHPLDIYISAKACTDFHFTGLTCSD